MNKLLIIILLILFCVVVFSNAFFTSKMQSSSFCYALGYDEAIRWDYSQKIFYNKSNYVDCCVDDVDECDRIYFDDYREAMGGNK